MMRYVAVFFFWIVPYFAALAVDALDTWWTLPPLLAVAFAWGFLLAAWAEAE